MLALRLGAGQLLFLEPQFPHLQNNACLAGLLQRLKPESIRILVQFIAHGRSSINVSLKKRTVRFDWACTDGKEISGGKAQAKSQRWVRPVWWSQQVRGCHGTWAPLRWVWKNLGAHLVKSTLWSLMLVFRRWWLGLKACDGLLLE